MSYAADGAIVILKRRSLALVADFLVMSVVFDQTFDVGQNLRFLRLLHLVFHRYHLFITLLELTFEPANFILQVDGLVAEVLLLLFEHLKLNFQVIDRLLLSSLG